MLHPRFTSVVVFDKEVFYERGIQNTNPGYTQVCPGLVMNSGCAVRTYSQYGQPLQTIGMGETVLDKQVFERYLAEMRRHCTPDNVWDMLLTIAVRSRSLASPASLSATSRVRTAWVTP